MADNLPGGSTVSNFIIWHDGNDKALLKKIILTGDIISQWEYDVDQNVVINSQVQNDSHEHTFANLLAKPTTLDGYGITDGVHEGDVVTLSGDVIGSAAFDSNGNVNINGQVQNDSHTHEWVNLTSRPTTIAGFGITDGVQEGDTVTLTGDVTGTANFDTNGDITLSTTVGDNSHLHSFSNITALPTTLAGYGITDGVHEGDTITLAGDVTGTADFDNNGNMTISVAVGNDTHTHAFSNLTSRPTTVAGYGITDAVQEGDSVTLIGDVTGTTTFDSSGNITLNATVGNNSHTHDFSNITTRPTTLAGYGITDAVHEGDTITLTGDVTGTASFDSNGNISMVTTTAGGDFYDTTTSDARYLRTDYSNNQSMSGSLTIVNGDSVNNTAPSLYISNKRNIAGAYGILLEMDGEGDGVSGEDVLLDLRANTDGTAVTILDRKVVVFGDGDTFFSANVTVANTLSAGTITETSALKYKENISTIDNSLDILQKLNGVHYEWKDTSKKDIGFIADEVLEILPELVHLEDGEVQGMNYGKLTAVLVNGINELTDTVKELTLRVKELETINEGA